jgi:hypothetical protein
MTTADIDVAGALASLRTVALNRSSRKARQCNPYAPEYDEKKTLAPPLKPNLTATTTKKKKVTAAKKTADTKKKTCQEKRKNWHAVNNRKLKKMKKEAKKEARKQKKIAVGKAPITRPNPLLRAEPNWRYFMYSASSNDIKEWVDSHKGKKGFPEDVLGEITKLDEKGSQAFEYRVITKVVWFKYHAESMPESERYFFEQKVGVGGGEGDTEMETDSLM